MMEDDKILPKSKVQMGPEDFTRLLKLCRERPWLQYEDRALYNLWHNTDSESQKLLLENLLKRFFYLTDELMMGIAIQMAVHIKDVWKLNGDNTIIVATCEGEQPDGSQAMLQKIKNKFDIDGWREKNFLTQIIYVNSKLKDNLNIVLIDDFIGTGKTIEKKVMYIENLLSKTSKVGIRIFIMTAAAMEFAKEKLDHLKIDGYHSFNWLKRGISEQIDSNQIQWETREMHNLEQKLSSHWGALPLHSFGFEGSEALFAISDYNIPNNVFPIFWWPYDQNMNIRERLFKRVSQRR